MQLEAGAVVSGKVTGITKYGAFIELENGKTGMVHISEVATVYVKEITDFLSVGQEVNVRILDIAADGKIALSLKRVEGDNNVRTPAPRPRAAAGAARDNQQPWKSSKSAEPKDFDDMLSKFMMSSDEKLSSIDRGERRSSRRGSGSRYKNDYYDD